MKVLDNVLTMLQGICVALISNRWSKKLLGVYGIFDTEKGDILFPIETKYDGSLYVYGCKFMHIVSVLGFYPYAKIYCYDESSYRYILKIALEKDQERG